MVFDKSIVDFHSHILPSVDHGSDSLETSIFQIDRAKRQGICKIIATPHFYPHQHNVEEFLQKRDAAYLMLRPHLGDVVIKLGAEVLLCPRLQDMPRLEELFVYRTKTLLLELPYITLTDEHYESVESMIKQGIDVVIAHPDRYSPEIIERMIAIGARLQLNASSLIGYKKNKKLYLKWIADGRVVALGSDIHGRDKKAYKKLLKCYKMLKNKNHVIIKESLIIWNKASVYKKNPTR